MKTKSESKILKPHHPPPPPVRPHHGLHLRVEEAEGQCDHQTVAVNKEHIIMNYEKSLKLI